MKKLSMVSLLLVLGFVLTGCGSQHYKVRGTENANATDAEIDVEPIDGGNHMVKLEAKHLLPPDRVSVGANSYVMWFRKANGDNIRASTLEYDADDRIGTAMATFPAKQFEIIVSAENSADGENPAGPVVIRQKVNM